MSINDFLNFIQLQKVDKRNLLNKLCNLDKLDSYLSIAKDLNKNFIKKIESIDSRIVNNQNLINEYALTISNIETTEEQVKKDREVQIKLEADVLKTKILEKKNIVKELDVTYSSIEVKIQELKNELTILANDEQITNNFITRLNEKITIFESGCCPTCESNLKDHNHNIELADFQSKKIEYGTKLLSIKKKKEKISADGREQLVKKNALIKSRDSEVKVYKDLMFDLDVLKKEFQTLVKNRTNNTTIDELNKSIAKLTSENENLELSKESIHDKIQTYERMIELMDEGGIRASVIKSIVKPINVNVSAFLNELGFKYRVVLDDEFNAKIFEKFVDEVNAETLSNGEMKIVNIVIALSYIKMIRSFKSINVLFLDEVFVSLDDAYVGLFLGLLKRMSHELGLNIVIIHHGISDVDMTHFDRVITVTNKMFSKIEDEIRQ